MYYAATGLTAAEIVRGRTDMMAIGAAAACWLFVLAAPHCHRTSVDTPYENRLYGAGLALTENKLARVIR